MLKTQKIEFFELLETTASRYMKTLTPAVKQDYWEALCYHDLYDIKVALRKHAMDGKRGRYMPQIADIGDYLPKPKQAIVKSNYPCMVHGCPYPATISEGGSTWSCSSHFRNPSGKAVETDFPKFARPSDEIFEKTLSEQKMTYNLLSAEEKKELIRNTIQKINSFGSRRPKVNRS